VTLLLRHEDVVELIDMSEAIEAMRDVFQLEGNGRTGKPERFDIPTGRGWLRLMPVVAEGMDAFGFKAMHLTQGVGVRYAIWVYALGSGELRGILDARVITATRTAATTAVATNLLARQDVRRTAVVGTGQEARTHVQAMQVVRPADEIRVYSRSGDNRQMFIQEMSAVVDAEFVDCSSVAEATKGAELVVLATKSPEPVLRPEHLEPGMHVNSIGAARSDQFEVAPELFPHVTTTVCDSSSHVFLEAGDAAAAVAGGFVDMNAVDDLANLVVGKARGRTDDQDITLYKSVGTATQDLALASRLLDLAEARGIGAQLGDFPDMKSFA
jgi:ornithine cyclodeaminase/alanine dehydrogenase